MTKMENKFHDFCPLGKAVCALMLSLHFLAAFPIWIMFVYVFFVLANLTNLTSAGKEEKRIKIGVRFR